MQITGKLNRVVDGLDIKFFLFVIWNIYVVWGNVDVVEVRCVLWKLCRTGCRGVLCVWMAG